MPHLSSISTAKMLLSLNAVSIRFDEPFKFSSGVRSPIYVHNMMLSSHTVERQAVVKSLESIARKSFSKPDTIATTIGGSVPWASQLAERLNLPLVYVRKDRKEYAHKNEIEGVLTSGARVLLVEASIGSATTIEKTAKRLRKSGAQVIGLLSIFDYELELSKSKLESIKRISLTSLTPLLNAAVQNGSLDAKGFLSINEWRKNPFGWYADNKRSERPLIRFV